MLCLLQAAESSSLYEINNYIKLLIMANMTNHKVKFQQLLKPDPMKIKVFLFNS